VVDDLVELVFDPGMMVWAAALLADTVRVGLSMKGTKARCKTAGKSRRRWVGHGLNHEI